MHNAYTQSVALIDTSALMKNPQLLDIVSPLFKRVVIPKICVEELSHLKDTSRRNGGQNTAWLALNAVGKFKDSILECPYVSHGRNDDRIIALAQQLLQKQDVVIITDDIDFKSKYSGTCLRPADVLAMQSQNSRSSINSYLSDGSGYTPLIDAIYKGDLQYVKHLVQKGADLNLTDCSKYFLTPLSHAIKANRFEIFDYLILSGADFNKGSINEGTASHIRVRNEGNTPLMIACWHGRIKFVNRLLQEKDLCLNQQDSNGYTALIKSAIKGNLKIFDLLMSHPETDPKIRDRNNHDAFWFLKNAN